MIFICVDDGSTLIRRSAIDNQERVVAEQGKHI